MSIPHILNYGMGVDSTAILLRWLSMSVEERGFELSDLIVLTAQTGDEFESTKQLVESYILPLLRQHQIRFVEVAKHGPYQRDGYTVLQDSREPWSLHVEGDYKLSMQMHKRGTVPAYSGPHLCAMKWKGFVLDSWLQDHLNSKVFGPYLGYSAEETKRADKCEEYPCRGNAFRFPLIEWGWTRADCVAFLQEQLGVEWRKSCCAYCPFQSRETAIARYQEDPEAAGFALFTEAISLALNPRMHLFSSGSAYDLIVKSGNAAALEAFEARLAASVWGVYRVERFYERKISPKSGKPYTWAERRVVCLSRGSREAMSAQLEQIATEHQQSVESSYCTARVYSHRRESGVYPAVEGFWVVCPAVVEDKVRNAKAFAQKWGELTGVERQLELSLI